MIIEYNNYCGFHALTISLLPCGPGIFSTLKPAAVMAFLTMLLLE